MVTGVLLTVAYAMSIFYNITIYPIILNSIF